MASDHGSGVQLGLRRYLGNRVWRWRWPKQGKRFEDLLADDNFDGVIAHVSKPDMAEVLRQSGLPVVNVSGQMPEAGLPRVGIDDRAVGQLAADHLAQLGFRHFLYAGVNDFGFSVTRGDAFMAALRDGPAMHVERIAFGLGSPAWELALDALAEVLTHGPKPLAVFTDNDSMAVNFCRIARAQGVAVPTDVAVLGVDNVRWKCEFQTPSLSSIDLPWEQVGYRAADLLERMMHGEAPPNEAILLPPTGVVQRESTSVLAVDDPLVRKALQLIETGATSGLNVDELVDELPVTRRTLQEKFKQALGRTPGEHLRLIRLKHTREMLVQTDRRLADVALRCGYCSQSHLTKAFRQATGQTPAAFRRQHRMADD